MTTGDTSGYKWIQLDADEYVQTQFAYYSAKLPIVVLLMPLMYKLLYPGIGVRTALLYRLGSGLGLVLVLVYGVTLLRILFCMCPTTCVRQHVRQHICIWIQVARPGHMLSWCKRGLRGQA